MTVAGKKRRIVGAHERRKVTRQLEIPVNIERVLLRAAADEAFRRRLLEDREGALADGGFELSGPERAMLSAMNGPVLESMAARFAPGSRRVGRFARKVATAVAGTMLVTTATCCTDGPSARDTSTDTRVDTMGFDTTGGIWPDVPDVVEDPDVDTEDWAVGGIWPDIPDVVEEHDVTDGDASDLVEEEDMEESDG